MSQANVSLVQSLYAAFGRGDIAVIVNACAPDIHWEINGRREDYPLFGARTGPAAVREFFESIPQLQDVIEFSPREFYAAQDKVFALGRYVWKLRKSGRTVDSQWIHVFTIDGSKVTRFHEFTDTAQYK
jgi:uncharacterized protein